MRPAILNHRGLLIAAVAAMSMVAGSFAVPASATTGVPRLLPFAVKGAISITAPSTMATFSYNVGDLNIHTYSSNLPLSVTDTRNIANSGWVAGITISKFTNQLGNVATDITINADPLLDATTTKPATIEYLYPTSNALPLKQSVMKVSGINGETTVNWNARFTVVIQNVNKPGFYTAKVVASVV